MTTPLPPTDPTAADDQLPGEAELAALYRQLPRSEPDPALDAAVLHAAAQALAAGEHPLAVERRRGPRERGDWVRPKGQPLPDLDAVGVVPRRRTPPWLLGLGSAASLVLVAGLAWHLHQRPASTPDAPVSAAPSTSAAADTGVAPAADRQPEVVAETAAAKATPPPLPRASMKAAADTTAARAAAPAPMAQSMSQPAQATAPPSPVVPPSVAERSAPATATPPAAPAPPTAEAAPMASDAVAQARGVGPAQERELAAIRQLFAEHHDAEAQRRLQDFRRQHPQRELPEDLRLRLRQP